MHCAFWQKKSVFTCDYSSWYFHENSLIVNIMTQVEIEGSDEVFIKSLRYKDLSGILLNKWHSIYGNAKIVILVLVWLVCSCGLMMNSVKIQHTHQISVSNGTIKGYIILQEPTDQKLNVVVDGAFLPQYYRNLSIHWMHIWVQLLVFEHLPKTPTSILNREIKPQFLQNVSEVWNIPLVSENLIGLVPEVKYETIFNLSSIQVYNTSRHLLELKFVTTLHKTNVPVSMTYNLKPIHKENGIIYAALVLTGLYVLIIFELIHRTLAAMLASTVSVAILAALNARPTMAEIISWIDVETLLLLFSMMVLVTILSETGIFDYLSVFAYKITAGNVWRLINTLCAVTAILSCFLDSVTTSLLITPVTIRLCEVMELNPTPVLIYMLIFGNIGGAITPIGDPPNVIISSNSHVMKSGVNFGVFTLHMGIGVALVFCIVYVQLRLTYRDISHFRYSEPLKVQELRREIAVWKRAAASLSSYSRDEDTVKESLMKQSHNLLGKLRLTANLIDHSGSDYVTNLQNLQRQYPIRNRVLLAKSGCTLFLVISVFFLHSFPAMSRLGLGWTALLGALLLLLLYDRDNIEGVVARVEWSTLLFFASLFILMEALARLGLIEWIGSQTQHIIMSVEQQEARLGVAIVLILWVSGFASAFVDNLPLTTMMVRIATNLAENIELALPLQPLVWSLSFGACFGGNGTLFGSSSNIVCAGVAEQHGYKFTFTEFMKVGLPVMITSMIVITFYLLICHVFLLWH